MYDMFSPPSTDSVSHFRPEQRNDGHLQRGESDDVQTRVSQRLQGSPDRRLRAVHQSRCVRSRQLHHPQGTDPSAFTSHHVSFHVVGIQGLLLFALFFFLQFINLQKLAVGNLAYARVDGKYGPLSVCQELYRNGTVDPGNDTFDIDPLIDEGTTQKHTIATRIRKCVAIVTVSCVHVV